MIVISYISYVEDQGIEPIPFNQFGDILDDFLRSQGYRDIVRKRRAYGRVVIGLILGYGQPIRRNKISRAMKYLVKLKPAPGKGRTVIAQLGLFPSLRYACL